MSAWQDDAACAGEGPDLWFPDGGNVLPAILVCNRCPVRRDCLADADETETVLGSFGIRGGLTANERVTRRAWLRRVAS